MSGARHRTGLGVANLEAAGSDEPAARGLDADPRAGPDRREVGAAPVELRGAEAADELRAELLRVDEEVDALAGEPADVLDLDLDLALTVDLELRLALGAGERARGVERDDPLVAVLRLHCRSDERECRESDDRDWDERALHVFLLHWNVPARLCPPTPRPR